MARRLRLADRPEPAPVVTLTPAHLHALRLESSPLYIRREREACATKQQAKLAAIWYGASDFRPRFHQ